MTALLVFCPTSDDLDLAITPLGRSLARQSDERWRLGPQDALTITGDDVVIQCEPHMTLRPDAVALLLSALEKRHDAAAVFCDVRVDGKVIRRAGWSPTRAITEPSAQQPLAARAGALDEAVLRDPTELQLVLARSGATVLHIPCPLVEGRPLSFDGSDSRPTQRHLRQMGISAAVTSGPRTGTQILEPDPDRTPRVSIIIPSAGASLPDRSERMLDQCLAGLRRLDGPTPEVIVVVGDEYAGDADALTDDASVRVVHRGSGPFDFSQAINSGLLAATQDLVLLLNDDVEPRTSDWLARMALHLGDPSVGAVGAALVYPDQSIQHLGLIIDDARPLHPFVGQCLADTAPHGGDVARDVIAVTGACLLARRRDLLAVGGLSAELPVSFNDVDLCLRLRRCGFRIVLEPEALLIHYEGATREPRIDTWEWDSYINRWGAILDPWYHPGHRRPDDPERLNLNADHLDPAEPNESPIARDTTLRPRVHRGRSASVAPPGPG